MSDSLSNISEKSGMPPGSLVHVGEIHGPESRISIINYSKATILEHNVQSVDEILSYKDQDSITWVIVEGLTNISIIESIGRIFNIHPLVLEDILNTHQRPKFDEYDEYLYIVLKGLLPETSEFSVAYEQISILVLKNFVFTFKEKVDEIFLPVIQRIRNSSRFRNLGTDYLTYAILDLIVDQNFTLVDALGDTIDSVEDELLSNPTSETLNTIQNVRREIVHIRRFISPLRDLLASIIRSDSEIIDEKNLIYFRDVLDHALRVAEAIDSYRDIFSGLLDIYISNLSNRMNQVMKVLTVFSSIFIPLTFIAGIYGMNFEYMPELKWRWAYPVLLAVFIVIPVVLLLYFKKKRWL
ncbi:MAG: magnesium/cobalt transporter CorA [Desulfamplus sp.]|nr:magnesium/cobalt transporter CorA [Desulfamplus sp.]